MQFVRPHLKAEPELENFPELPLWRLAVQIGEAEHLLGGDAVDVPPETAIELPKGRKLIRVAG